jgi:hypothetical protein
LRAYCRGIVDVEVTEAAEIVWAEGRVAWFRVFAGQLERNDRFLSTFSCGQDGVKGVITRILTLVLPPATDDAHLGHGHSKQEVKDSALIQPTVVCLPGQGKTRLGNGQERNS